MAATTAATTVGHRARRKGTRTAASLASSTEGRADARSVGLLAAQTGKNWATVEDLSLVLQSAWGSVALWAQRTEPLWVATMGMTTEARSETLLAVRKGPRKGPRTAVRSERSWAGSKVRSRAIHWDALTGLSTATTTVDLTDRWRGSVSALWMVCTTALRLAILRAVPSVVTMAVQMAVLLAGPTAVTMVADWADALVAQLADHWVGLLGTA
jgi:hypothetical protein